MKVTVMLHWRIDVLVGHCNRDKYLNWGHKFLDVLGM